jgi:transglutaminase-like putative cysteine protease
VASRVEAEITSVASVVLSVAVADHHERSDEVFRPTVDGRPVEFDSMAGAHHGRLHLLREIGPGRLVVDYQATVVGTAPPFPATDLDWFRYVRPSRYCESDRLGPLARDEFADLEGRDLVTAVSSWVGANINYVTGSSRPIDGAVAALLAREGVCRDFAHITAALLRANDIPARVASVYAPGLRPMDFHVVTEACIDGVWQTVDPTGLAPRQSMARIATGVDATDVAFLTTLSGRSELIDVWVNATAYPTLPIDAPDEIVELG